MGIAGVMALLGLGAALFLWRAARARGLEAHPPRYTSRMRLATHAIDAPSVAMVELLVSRGANVDACDASRRSVAEHAKRSPYLKELAALLRR